MIGGVDSPNQSSVSGQGLNMSDLDVSGQSSVVGPGLNMSDLDVSGQSNISDQPNDVNIQQGFQGWVNPDYSGNTTFETYQSQQSNNSGFSLPSVLEQESIATSVGSEQGPFDADISMISDDEEDVGYMSDGSNDEQPPFGGKRRTLAKKNKRKTNKRKTKKSKKTRKNRKRRQRGGDGFTTSITTNPIAYKEDEYDQFKNALNYKS